MYANQGYIVKLCLDANFGQPSIQRDETWHKVWKAPVNHEPAPEFAPLRIAAEVDVAVRLPFAPLSYQPHFLDGDDVSPAFYEGIRQPGRATITIGMFQVHIGKT